VLYVNAGLAPFLMMAEALSVSVTSVLSGKFVLESGGFPIDLVPAKAVLTSQASMLVGFALVVAGDMVAGTLTWTVLMFPLVWALCVLGLIGLAWILSLVYLVFRDLPYLIGVVLLLLMIASPIAYTPEMVPPGLRPLVLLNPFAYVVTASQQVLVAGRLPGPRSAALLVGGSIGLFLVGGWFFSRAKGVLIDHA
jgi:homopolymeric O-antigen transport system permease protein